MDPSVAGYPATASQAISLAQRTGLRRPRAT
ncbi:hypothetical protein ABIA35_007598 [Catenulispora sp. MAP12-49]